jgi:hypothetical protein
MAEQPETLGEFQEGRRQDAEGLVPSGELNMSTVENDIARATLAALRNINGQLTRIADHMQEHEDKADDRIAQLRNDLGTAIYTVAHKT